MIEINDVRKRFGKVQVLDGVSFDIRDGGVFAILGPNGSGKTTLLKMMLGMVVPDGGDIRINQESVTLNYRYRKNIAYLPQIARFPDNLRVKELIHMLKDVRALQGRDEWLIDRFDLGDMLKMKLGELSGGTRQKVNIVLSFMFDAELCILDEPTAGLDPVAMIELKQLIAEERNRGKIIIITTHIMPLVQELAEEIIFLLDGKVRFQGPVKALLNGHGENDLEHAIAEMLVE